MHIAIFGGSFDPPHIGHQMVCLYVLSTTPVDALWIVPTHVHAFGKPLAPFEHRLAMCRALAEPLGARVAVSDIERTRGGVSRTADTVRAIKAAHPADRFSLIVGADLLAEIPTWYDGDKLPALVDFIIVGRSGHQGGGDVAMPDVSSTTVRQRLAAGQSCVHLVPRNVLALIEANGLYRA